jgi:hypothetical protein
LQAEGLAEDASFQLIVNPNGGLLIQSVDEINAEKFDKHYRELSVELFELMKSLSNESKTTHKKTSKNIKHKKNR